MYTVEPKYKARSYMEKFSRVLKPLYWIVFVSQAIGTKYFEFILPFVL